MFVPDTQGAHQETTSIFLFSLIILSQMLWISDIAMRIFAAPVLTKAICVSIVCLLKHLKLVLPRPIFQHQSIVVTLFLACLHRLFKK
jgi:hypothetical protein